MLFLAKAQVLDCQPWRNLGSLILSRAVSTQSCPLFLPRFFPLVYKLNSARQSFSFLQWAVAVSKWQPIFTVLFIISCFLKIQKRFSKVSGVGCLNCHLCIVMSVFLPAVSSRKMEGVGFDADVSSSFFHLLLKIWFLSSE